jgi:hypothetical protein
VLFGPKSSLFLKFKAPCCLSQKSFLSLKTLDASANHLY